METFRDSGLHPDIVRGVEQLGFETPTPIQKMSIEHLLEHETDLIAFAQTGTGKTAAFSLPILHQIDPELEHVQAIILAPTRELCLQIGQDLESYTKFMPVKATSVYGGAPIVSQIRELAKKPRIVVGTPGRTLDLIQRGKLRIDGVQFLVLDEADEMLSMGFQDELDAILANTPDTKQTLLFSATMPDGMKKLTAKYLNDPKEISAGKRNVSASKVEHELYVVRANDTYEAMRRIMDFNPDMYGIVFCRTRRETQAIAEQLMNDGYRAEAIHGDLSQAQRDDVMNRFRNKSISVLVATDVAARGIDVSELTHVINVNIPDDPEVYVHRSGRTGRAGKSGTSIVITHGRSMRKIQTLERIIGKKFTPQEVPSGDAICEVKLKEAIDDLVSHEVAIELNPALVEEAMDRLAHLSKADLIERFLGHETSTIISRYRGAKDINVKTSGSRFDDRDNDRERKPHGKKDSTGREAGFATLIVDLGYRHKVNPSRLIGMINDTMEGTKLRIGKIDMDKTFSRIDIEEGYVAELAAKLNGLKTGSYVVNAYFEDGNSAPRAPKRPSYSKGREFNGGGGGYSGGAPRAKTGRFSDSDRGGRFNSDSGPRRERTGNRFEDRKPEGTDRRERTGGNRFEDRKPGGYESRGSSDSRGGGFERRERTGGADFRDKFRATSKGKPYKGKGY